MPLQGMEADAVIHVRFDHVFHALGGRSHSGGPRGEARSRGAKSLEPLRQVPPIRQMLGPLGRLNHPSVQLLEPVPQHRSVVLLQHVRAGESCSQGPRPESPRRTPRDGSGRAPSRWGSPDSPARPGPGRHRRVSMAAYLRSPSAGPQAARKRSRWVSRPATGNTAVVLDDPAPSAYSTVARS